MLISGCLTGLDASQSFCKLRVKGPVLLKILCFQYWEPQVKICYDALLKYSTEGQNPKQNLQSS